MSQTVGQLLAWFLHHRAPAVDPEGQGPAAIDHLVRFFEATDTHFSFCGPFLFQVESFCCVQVCTRTTHGNRSIFTCQHTVGHCCGSRTHRGRFPRRRTRPRPGPTGRRGSLS